MSFPSGVLRWTGSWVVNTIYRYGDIALASTNVSYACGVSTSLNVDPATQPSSDWFPFPNQGGGVAGVTSLSGVQGVITQSCQNGIYSTSGGNILLEVAYPILSVTAGTGLTNTGDNINVILATSAAPIQTFEIDQASTGVNATEQPLWNVVFTPTVTGAGVLNFNVVCQSTSDSAPSLLLELFYSNNGGTSFNSLGTINFLRPAGVIGTHNGYNGSFSRYFPTSPSSMIIQLQGTCNTVGGPILPWTVVSSTGYIQTNFPILAV